MLKPDWWRAQPGTRRCAACRRWVPPGRLIGTALGLGASLCGFCASWLEFECVARYGRLPHRGEFFCRGPGCRSIQPIARLTRPDRDGRRRWLCRPCRARQVAVAHAASRRRPRRLRRAA